MKIQKKKSLKIKYFSKTPKFCGSAQIGVCGLDRRREHEEGRLSSMGQQ